MNGKELLQKAHRTIENVYKAGYADGCSDKQHDLDHDYAKGLEDAVSRQTVKDTIFVECSGTKLDIDFAKVLLLQRAIKALPPVTPQESRWIPVTERLPDKLTNVNIAFDDCPNEYDVAYLRTTVNETYRKNGAENEWVSLMGEVTYADYEVSAWMEIKPYKAESEVEDRNDDRG